MTATSVSASAFLGSWGSSIAGEDHTMLQTKVVAPPHVRGVDWPVMKERVCLLHLLFSQETSLGRSTRNIIGKKRFNQLRGKGIALHSQVITEFCKSIGSDSKQRQGLILLAKKNGERLGFLA